MGRSLTTRSIWIFSPAFPHGFRKPFSQGGFWRLPCSRRLPTPPSSWLRNRLRPADRTVRSLSWGRAERPPTVRLREWSNTSIRTATRPCFETRSRGITTIPSWDFSNSTGVPIPRTTSVSSPRPPSVRAATGTPSEDTRMARTAGLSTSIILPTFPFTIAKTTRSSTDTRIPWTRDSKASKAYRSKLGPERTARRFRLAKTLISSTILPCSFPKSLPNSKAFPSKGKPSRGLGGSNPFSIS